MGYHLVGIPCCGAEHLDDGSMGKVSCWKLVWGNRRNPLVTSSTLLYWTVLDLRAGSTVPRWLLPIVSSAHRRPRENHRTLSGI